MDKKRNSKSFLHKRAFSKKKSTSKDSADLPKISMELRHAYGFHEQIKNGIFYTGPKSIFYMAGQMGVFHNLEDQNQRFIPFQDQHEFTAIAHGSKHIMALASKRSKPSISIYNLKTGVKKNLPCPEMDSSHYVCLGFSPHDEFLAAQAGGPDWLFVLWTLNVRRLDVVHRASRPELGSQVYEFAFHPDDPLQIVLVGRSFLRFLRYCDRKVMRERIYHDLERSGQTFTSVVWMSSDTFAVASSFAKIIMFRNDHPFREILIDDIDNPSDIGVPSDPKCVSCLLRTADGLICSYGGNRALILKPAEDGEGYKIATSVHLPADQLNKSYAERINHIILNANEELLVASTDAGQLLAFSFMPEDILKHLGHFHQYVFVTILQRQSQGAVISQDRAARKPLLVTCSSHCLILWDYLKEEQRLWYYFDEELSSVSIQPIGLTLAVSFRDAVKIYSIRLNEIVEMLTVDSKGNDRICYSRGGQFLAVANEAAINVYFSLGFKHYASFTKKGGTRCLEWSINDTRLYFCSDTGEITECDMVKKSLIGKYSIAEVMQLSLAPYKEGVYVAGSDCKIRYFVDKKIKNEMKLSVEVTSMVVMRTEKIIFCGTKKGTLVGYVLPLQPNACAVFEVICHHGDISNLDVNDSCSLLFATGVDGLFTKWEILDPERIEGEEDNQLSDEILVAKETLENDKRQIGELELQLGNLEMKYDRERKEQEERHLKEKRDAIDKYEKIIDDLKNTVTELTLEKQSVLFKKEKSALEKSRAVVQERNENLENAEMKLQKEVEHYQVLEKEYDNLKESFEERIKKLHKQQRSSYLALCAGYWKKTAELQQALQEEKRVRERLAGNSASLLHALEEDASMQRVEDKTQFMADFQMYRSQIVILEGELEVVTDRLSYEQECGNTLEAVRQTEAAGLKRFEQMVLEIRDRIHQLVNLIRKKEAVLENQARMIRKLQEENDEMRRLNCDVECELEQWRKKTADKSMQIAILEDERDDLVKVRDRCVDERKAIMTSNFLMADHLKSAKVSIEEDTAKLQKVQIILERYKSEFVAATEGVADPRMLRLALLRVFEKHVRTCRMIKEEEVSLGDLNPYTKFCRQRDHYGEMMDVVRNRINEVESTFNKKYVKLAKENSELTAFANALLDDLHHLHDRIRCLEVAVGLPCQRFGDNPRETRRLFEASVALMVREEQEGEQELARRRKLIQEQEAELLRLQALLVVGEDGRIIRERKDYKDPPKRHIS